MNRNRMILSLSLLRRLMGLPEDVKVTGVCVDARSLLMVDIEGDSVPPSAENGTAVTPCYELVAIPLENRLSDVYEMQAYWEHEPDRRWRHPILHVSREWAGR